MRIVRSRSAFPSPMSRGLQSPAIIAASLESNPLYAETKCVHEFKNGRNADTRFTLRPNATQTPVILRHRLYSAYRLPVVADRQQANCTAMWDWHLETKKGSRGQDAPRD